MITIETIDRSDGSNRVVGYGYFPIFMNGNTRRQSTDRNATNVILQTGNYQIPLYMNMLSVDKDITIENI
jgi:choline dehydrogenase-like flavoprotein